MDSTKTAVFVLRAFNDIDQLTPVIWQMSKGGAPTRAIFVDLNANISVQEEPHLKFLEKSGCPVHYFYALPESPIRFPNRLLGSPLNPLAVKWTRLFKKGMARLVWTGAWAEQCLKKMNAGALLVDHHEPDAESIEGKLIYAAKRLGLPVLCLSHGPNVNTAFDFNLTHPKKPRQSDLKVFYPGYLEYDALVPTSAPEKPLWEAQAKSLGFELNGKLKAMGSPRFSPEWIEINRALVPPFHAEKNASGKLKVLFFLSRWQMKGRSQYVDKEKTLEALETLSRLDFVYLVMKEHTREGVGDLPQAMRDAFAKGASTQVIQSAKSLSFKNWVKNGFRAPNLRESDSSALVSWADAVICLNSSIGLEAIAQKKPLIYPGYLYHFATAYEAFNSAMFVESPEELVRTLQSLKKEGRIPYSTESIEREIVYAGQDKHDVLKSYQDWIVSRMVPR